MDVLALLQSSFPDVICHDAFYEEVSSLLRHELSGKQALFGSSVIRQLFFVKSLGKEVYKADSNEILKHTDINYYSLHLQRKEFNVRFLAYIDDNTAYLLCAFFERSGKRKTSYENYIPVLNSRLNDLLGG